MVYRAYKEMDRMQILKMCKDEGIDPPSQGIVFVAEDDSDKTKSPMPLVGFICLKSVLAIEPFICRNGISSNILFHMAQGAIAANGAKEVMCFTKNKDNKDLFTKVGFHEVLSDAYVLQKDY